MLLVEISIEYLNIDHILPERAIKLYYCLVPRDLESIWIEVKLPHTKPILFCSVYRPPNSPSEWIDKFELEVQKASDLNDFEIIIAGDINIDLSKPVPQKWKCLCDLYNQEQMVSSPTRITAESQTLIDHIYIPTSQKIFQKFRYLYML